MTQTTLNIPTPLRAYVDGLDEIQMDSVNTVDECLTQLVTQYPTMKQHLFDEQGQLRKFVNIYVKDEDIRQLDGLKTKLDANSEVSIVPSIAGG